MPQGHAARCAQKHAAGLVGQRQGAERADFAQLGNRHQAVGRVGVPQHAPAYALAAEHKAAARPGGNVARVAARRGSACRDAQLLAVPQRQRGRSAALVHVVVLGLQRHAQQRLLARTPGQVADAQARVCQAPLAQKLAIGGVQAHQGWGHQVQVTLFTLGRARNAAIGHHQHALRIAHDLVRIHALCGPLRHLGQRACVAHRHPALAGAAVGLGGVEPLPVVAGHDVAVKGACRGLLVQPVLLHQLALGVQAHQPLAWAAGNGQEAAPRLGQQAMRPALHGRGLGNAYLACAPVQLQHPHIVGGGCGFGPGAAGPPGSGQAGRGHRGRGARRFVCRVGPGAGRQCGCAQQQSGALQERSARDQHGGIANRNVYHFIPCCSGARSCRPKTKARRRTSGLWAARAAGPERGEVQVLSCARPMRCRWHAWRWHRWRARQDAR